MLTLMVKGKLFSMKKINKSISCKSFSNPQGMIHDIRESLREEITTLSRCKYIKYLDDTEVGPLWMLYNPAVLFVYDNDKSVYVLRSLPNGLSGTDTEFRIIFDIWGYDTSFYFPKD